MKWFTASNQASLENASFFQLVQVAVVSLQERTTLDPHFLYDGEECSATEWLRSRQVKIVPTKLTFYDSLREFMLPNYQEHHIACRAGAFLRTELPVSIRAAGILDDCVLYTDCDVLFMSEIHLEKCRPKYFAAHGTTIGGRTRFRIGGHYHINSGVMVINVDAMLEQYDALRKFILGNGLGVRRPTDPFMQKNLFMSDQVALNLFFRGRITKLKSDYNWNPANGFNKNARIVHFNGLKWNQWDDYCSQKLPPELNGKYDKLVERNRDSYRLYAEEAKQVFGSINDSKC